MNPIKFRYVLAKRKIRKTFHNWLERMFWRNEYEWLLENRKEEASWRKQVDLIGYGLARSQSSGLRRIWYLELILRELATGNYDLYDEYKKLGGFSKENLANIEESELYGANA